MGKQPLFIELGDIAPDQQDDGGSHPPPEDEFGGGDICSIEEGPSTDDDKPLD